MINNLFLHIMINKRDIHIKYVQIKDIYILRYIILSLLFKSKISLWM